MTRRSKMLKTAFVCLAAGGTFCISACSIPTTRQRDTSDSPARLERIEAVHEIQNVMSKHAFYYSAGQHQRELDEIWAMKTPGLSWGSDEGYWIGPESITNYYVHYFDQFRARDLAAFSKLHPEVANLKENYGAGTSMFHTNSTPVIEVAEDGKTAKGIWYSVGQVTQTPGGKQTAMYMWERYAVDFTKENGRWKIWHFYIHTDFASPPGGSWVREEGSGSPGSPPPGAGPAGPPPGGGQPGESGGAPKPDIANQRPGPGDSGRFTPPQEFPKVPQPYRTFGETFSYGPPGR